MKRARAIKILKSIAEVLPNTDYSVSQNYSIHGEDIHLTGLKVSKGMEIEPDKEYQFKGTASIEVNHERRLVRAYTKNGKPGVIKYIKDHLRSGDHTNFFKLLDSLLIQF